MSTKNKTRSVFVSVGTRFPMDRLLQSIEQVVTKHPNIIAKAQTGNSNYKSSVLELVRNLNSNEFETAVKECDVFVSHAGMGNLLLAAQLNKPIVIMPRQACLKEHINDHQMEMTSALKKRPDVMAVNNIEELEIAILLITNSTKVEYNTPILINNSQKGLISAIKEFIDND